ncbi:LytR/AlgR family response regulator transcription factor [Xanthovirga aplysinae]|uniref:LytR/AlgR family response regulator transcription factor n=1 Tax=Xanthovirga aplysinae TaxID=2529853 RepID=UPI0012BD3F5F|nr:LytTR family DNA-binding domain-containing protein [Xanthovirga aplysinae]MTI32326.1 response regulator transcription factor [Xanthovirga aplysinae]
MTSQINIKCLIVDDEVVSRQTLKYFVDQTLFLSFQKEAESAMDAVKILKKEPIDLIFLDINMPKMSGFDLLEFICEPMDVIIVSAEKDHALRAFDLQVIDYLLKPFQYNRFLKAVDKVRNKWEERRVNSQEISNVFIKEGGRRIRINLLEVLFVEAWADYVILHTHTRKHILHFTMKGIEKRLPTGSFVRVHRSYIININQIESVEESKIKIKGREIPIGVSFKGNFLSKLHMF